MLFNPYKRIYRENQNKSENSIENKSTLRSYVQSEYYCSNRLDLVRYYKSLEKDFLSLTNYIEPNDDNLDTYSTENAKLLMNICVEVENNLKGILADNGFKTKKDNEHFTMQHYSKLNECLKLTDYEIEIELYYFKYKFKPFEKADNLPWYNSYDAIKHDRSKNLKEATLKNIIYALGALYVLLYAQFGLFCDCASDKGASNFQLMYGGKNSFNSISIFNILNTPKFNEDEQYYFKWSDENNNIKFFKEYYKQ